MLDARQWDGTLATRKSKRGDLFSARNVNAIVFDGLPRSLARAMMDWGGHSIPEDGFPSWRLASEGGEVRHALAGGRLEERSGAGSRLLGMYGIHRARYETARIPSMPVNRPRGKKLLVVS